MYVILLLSERELAVRILVGLIRRIILELRKLCKGSFIGLVLPIRCKLSLKEEHLICKRSSQEIRVIA